MNEPLLEAALVRGLADAWAMENDGRFRGRLRRPVFRVMDTRRLGFWDLTRREIVLARNFIRERPWGVVVEVLKHEMAHQYVHEVLGVLDESAHGAAFRDTCARFGIDARASGEPDPGEVDSRVISRIQKLLALAGSPNRHEAEAAMTAAQTLLLRHNLSEVVVRAEHRTTWAHLGVPMTRVGEGSRLLAAILGSHFFVEVIWVPVWMPERDRTGQILEVCGSVANVQFAAYVHDFLQSAAQRLWQEVASQRPQGGRTAFTAGVMRGFLEKLATQEQRHAEEGLVWKGDPAAQRYLRARHPHIHHIRRSGPSPSAAFQSGQAAGRSLVLHRPVEQGSTQPGRRLTGPRSS